MIGNIVRVFIVLIFLANTQTFAQTSEKGMYPKGDVALSSGLIQGTRWALLIGIADYPSSAAFDVQKLKAPVKDVQALAEFLKDTNKGGFESDHVFVMTNEKATRRDILITLNEIAKKVTKDDMVIFFFSGHGYYPGGGDTTYLIPYDYDISDLETTCINFDDLSKKIQKMEASKVLMILDACHSGGVKPKGARDAGTYVSAKYSESFQNAQGRYMLLSSDESEISWETENCGIFTNFLLDGLNGKADKDNDGIVTFTEAAYYVEKTVPEYTRKNFPKEQKPTRRGDLGGAQRGDIPLAININVVNRLRQDEVRSKRKEAVLLAGLDVDLKEFSLNVIQSAYDKPLKNESMTKEESALITEIDALQAEKIPSTEYIDRAGIIYNRFAKPTPIPAQKPPPPKPAVIEYAEMPKETKVFINGLQVNLPYQAQPGTYSIRLERDGFEKINLSQTLSSKQALRLNPNWVQIKKIDIPLPIKTIKEPSRFNAKSFGKSLFVPGLGQHSSGYKKRGIVYETIVLGIGAIAIGTSYYHHTTVENFRNAKDDLLAQAQNQTELTSQLNALLDDQNRYYKRSKTTRGLAIASQIAFGVAWGVNAFDAGIVGRSGDKDGSGLSFRRNPDKTEVLISMVF